MASPIDLALVQRDTYLDIDIDADLAELIKSGLDNEVVKYWKENYSKLPKPIDESPSLKKYIEEGEKGEEGQEEKKEEVRSWKSNPSIESRNFDNAIKEVREYMNDILPGSLIPDDDVFEETPDSRKYGDNGDFRRSGDSWPPNRPLVPNKAARMAGSLELEDMLLTSLANTLKCGTFHSKQMGSDVFIKLEEESSKAHLCLLRAKRKSLMINKLLEVANKLLEDNITLEMLIEQNKATNG